MTPEKLLQGVLEVISQGRERLSQGELLDLTGMERDVEAMCDMVLKLTPQERENFVGPMEALQQQLTQLGDELVTVRDLLVQKMGALPTHQKANIAYKSADAVDNFGARTKPEEE